MPSLYHSPVMSAAPFRQPHDPARLAALGATLEGPVPLKDLARLAPVFGPRGPSDSEVVAVLRFSAHRQGLVLIEGRIEGRLRLQCQRCLEDLWLPLSERFRLALQTGVTSSAAPDDFEMLERVGDTLVPIDLLEEELLLAVPLVVKHQDLTVCGPLARRYAGAESEDHGGRVRPFADLRRLRKSDTNLD